MDSDFQQQQYQHHLQDFPIQQYQHHQKQQTSSLTRFRSAPSSYFASFLDVATDTVAATGGTSGGGGGGGVRGDFANARPLSPETENIFARFMSNIGAEMNSSSQKPSNLPVNPTVQPQFTVRVKQETDIQQQENQEEQQQQLQQQQQQQQLQQQHMQQQQQQQQQIQQGNYSDQSQMLYQSPSSKAPMSNQHNSAVSSAMQTSFRAAAASSMGSASISQMKTGFGARNINNNSSLTRHSSSPAGFFENLKIDAGYGIMSGMGNYGGGIGGNVQVNISSGQSTNSELLNRNSDVGTKRLRIDSLDERRFSNSSNNNSSNYEFPMNSWDDSILSESFSGLEGVQEEDRKIFPELNATENQGGEGKNRPPSLTHHLSLSKTRPELSNMEKFLQFQESVPLRIRAKRGCATHPRSIAERVRRTRISERMRKLQDLVPNMDKQTNTADMLDLAVDYIKDLQKQFETLDDNRAKCTCSR